MRKNNWFVIIVLFLSFCLTGCNRSFFDEEEVNPSQTLWYDEPASIWEEALPLGNGRLGAMVFGGTETENIQFKEIEVYKTSLNPQRFPQEFEGVLFFSPSAVQSFTAKNQLKETTAFCIGNTTAAEAQKHTNNIIIATKPTIENVIVQVVNYFGASARSI